MTDKFTQKHTHHAPAQSSFLNESPAESIPQVSIESGGESKKSEVVPQENHSRTMLIFFCISITMLIIVIMSIKIFKYYRSKPKD